MILDIYIGLHVKYMLFSSNFKETWFSRWIFEIFVWDITKIRSMRVELLHAGVRMDGQTCATDLIVAFRSFVNAPKTGSASCTFTWLKANFTFLTSSFSFIFTTNNRHIATLTRRPLESMNRGWTVFVLTSPSVCCQEIFMTKSSAVSGIVFWLVDLLRCKANS